VAKTDTQSLSVTGGMRMDPVQTVEAFSVWSRMNLGWRDVVTDAERGLLYVRVGSSRVVRKLIIRLNALDLYDIEIGKMDKRTYDWVVEGQKFDLYAEQLADAAISLLGEVAG
jgi:hypothetical protein